MWNVFCACKKAQEDGNGAREAMDCKERKSEGWVGFGGTKAQEGKEPNWGNPFKKNTKKIEKHSGRTT